jgi:hypothetical protein
MRTLLLAFCTVTCFAQGRINAGGPAFTDALGQLWQADAYFTGGAISTGAIPPGTPGYYLTKRYGDFSYLLPVPAGQYTVALDFIENVVGPGARVFSVSIDGAPVLTNYDIAADVGQNVPVRKIFPATAANSGILIQFTTVTRSALVNAIEFGPAPAVVVQSNNKGQCEDELATGNGAGNSGGLFVAPYAFFSCKNVSGGPLLITRFNCQTDVAGQVADLQVKGTDGLLHSVLASPIVCTTDGAEGSVLPGASYNDGDVLWWFVRIVAPTDPSLPLVNEVLLSAVREQAPVGAVLAFLESCSGSGPGWDCGGLLHAAVQLVDGSMLSIVGVAMAPPANPATVWTAK